VQVIKSELAMKFRKRFVKGFISPGSCNLYLGATIGNLLFGVMGFSNPDYGKYDLIIKADTTPSEFEKSTDLLLFALRSREVKLLLEKKFCREISNVYSMCFSSHPSIQRYKKHGELINKKVVKENKTSADEKTKRAANSFIARGLKNGSIIKQPCEVCGSKEYVEAHHKDYSKKEEVNWLCTKHHNERDAIDETCYKIIGYDLGYIFQLGSIPSLKEAKAQFIQKSWKK